VLEWKRKGWQARTEGNPAGLSVLGGVRPCYTVLVHLTGTIESVGTPPEPHLGRTPNQRSPSHPWNPRQVALREGLSLITPVAVEVLVR